MTEVDREVAFLAVIVGGMFVLLVESVLFQMLYLLWVLPLLWLNSLAATGARQNATVGGVSPRCDR